MSIHKQIYLQIGICKYISLYARNMARSVYAWVFTLTLRCRYDAAASGDSEAQRGRGQPEAADT